MRKLFTILVLSFLLLGVYSSNAQSISRKAMIDSLTTVDPEIKKYFPRWKICETDLQIQIHKTFQLLGYPEKSLDMTRIEVLATPRQDEYTPYEILMISCGDESMNATELEANLGMLVDYISGQEPYSGNNTGLAKRDYCYDEIPPNIPITDNQVDAIVNFLEPNNVTHSFSISLFEQSLKVGESSFWLKSIFGSDEIGYPFWTSGEAKLLLKRPLYVNHDSKTSRTIPNLINAYLGGGYRITSGLPGQGGILDFIPDRILNSTPNGKIIAGFDFNFPLHPFVGLHFNYEAPTSTKSETTIEKKSFGHYNIPVDANLEPTVFTNPDGVHSEDSLQYIVPVLQSTGQITIFYNLWMNPENPENFFRGDLGVSYSEVQEYALLNIGDNDPNNRPIGDYITTKGIVGLKMYKPNEFADWLYFKLEYRNQSTYPFGVSIQFSNQIFLGRVYLPLLSPWLYLEGKYSTPMRTARPYEIENFFMISPVIRITI